uniref:Uncharacterized protein n=1 Tax=virus sp. ctPYc18 TaxID=2828251 RepID=A0A8S5RC90_9VIRU|nr:MAG TPA: hypothetical protein [virus sp. ctPYc18]
MLNSSSDYEEAYISSVNLYNNSFFLLFSTSLIANGLVTITLKSNTLLDSSPLRTFNLLFIIG